MGDESQFLAAHTALRLSRHDRVEDAERERDEDF
jgi:hypothetical protein